MPSRAEKIAKGADLLPGSAGEARRNYHVPAAVRVLALLEFIASAGTALGVSEIARQTGIPKSSCFALLTTLEHTGYARRDEKDEWLTTLRVYHVGLAAVKNTDIQSVAQPILRELCETTGLTTHLGTFTGGSIIYAVKVDPPEGMVKFDTYPGKRASVHLTAMGRAIASIMDEAQLAALLDGYDFSGGANSSISSRSSFASEMRRIRKRGYAVELEEETKGVACIAAPVIAPRAAAIGVAALAAQIQERSVEWVSAKVVEAAGALSDLLGSHELEHT